MLSQIAINEILVKSKDEKIENLKEKKHICNKEIQFLRNENKALSEKIKNLEEFFEKEDEEREIEEEKIKKEYNKVKLGLVRDPEFKFETKKKGGFICKKRLEDIAEVDRKVEGVYGDVMLG